MTITYTITRKTVEGNRRANYGNFTMTSAEVVTRTLDTGLRSVDTLQVWDQANPTITIASGIGGTFVAREVTAKCTYPTTWPALDSTSGHFTIEFTSTAGPILWKAVGRI